MFQTYRSSNNKNYCDHNNINNTCENNNYNKVIMMMVMKTPVINYNDE